MTSLDAHEARTVGRARASASSGMSWARVGWLARGVAVLLTAGLALTACSGGGSSPTASSTSSPPQAELPPGGNAQPPPSTGQQHPGESGHLSKRHARLVVNNGKISVCSLISADQVNQIMQADLPRPRPVIVGTFDECATTQRHRHSSSATLLHVAWAVPPEVDPSLAFKQMTVSLPRSDAIKGLGTKAYCSSGARPASSQLFIIVGGTLLEVFADTCGHATALAKVALGRI